MSTVAFVTGANRGIGFETALGLARTGAAVVLHARNEERGREAIARLRAATGSNALDLVTADLREPEKIHAAAETLVRRHPDLNLLVNNAGLVADTRKITRQGYEETFAVNHLAPYLLTALLRERLVRNAPARVVTVASEAHRRSRLDLDDLHLTRRFHPLRAYGRSKLANILFTYELARRLDGSGVTANCLHPGVVDTGLMVDFMQAVSVLSRLVPVARALSVNPEEGAETSVYLAVSEEVEGLSGGYYVRCHERRSNRQSYDRAVARELWERSAALTGLE